VAAAPAYLCRDTLATDGAAFFFSGKVTRSVRQSSLPAMETTTLSSEGTLHVSMNLD